MALTAGTLSRVTVTQTSLSLLSTAPTGGTTPYLYQWYRSTTSGFTPGTANALSGATLISLANTGLSAATQYYYKVIYTDSNATPLTVTSAQLAAATAVAGQNQNQFAMTVNLGKIDLPFNYNTVSVQIDATEAGTLKAGQAVKMFDSVDGIPKVVACAANTDECLGFINYSIKDSSFVAGDRCEISMAGNVMYLLATGAIARGAQVTLDVTAVGGVQSAVTADKIVGWAFDKATTGGVLIRVFVKTPSFTVA